MENVLTRAIGAIKLAKALFAEELLTTGAQVC